MRSIVPAFCILLLSCCTNHNKIVADESSLLSVNQLNISSTKYISISYDVASKYSVFDKDDTLYATVNFRQPHSVVSRRYRLTKQNGVCNVRIKIDSNAYFFDISVGIREQVMGTENYASPVYENGVPKKNSLAFMMYSSNSELEINNLFKIDEKYYPSATARYIPFFISKARTEEQRVLRAQIKSLLRTPVSNYDDRIISYSACMAGYYCIKDFRAALRVINLLIREYRRGTPLPTPLTNAMAYILQSTSSEEYAEMKNAHMYRVYIRKTIDLIFMSRNIGLITLVYRLGELFPFQIVAQELNNTYYGLEANSAINEMDNKDAVGAIELMHYVCKELMVRRNYMAVLQMISRHEPAITDACIWLQENPEKPVTNYPDYGMESVLRLQQAASMMKLGMKDKGIHVLQSLVLRNVREEYLYAMDSACSSLISYYISSNDVDSVEKYLAYSIIMGSPSSGALYVKYLQSFRNSSGIRSKGDLIKRYKRQQLLLSRKSPHVVVERNGKHIDFASKKSGGNILIFSSRDCSVCSKVLPEVLLYAIRNQQKDMNIVLFSDIPKSRIQASIRCDDDDFIWMDLHHEASRKFGISGYPSIIIIKNGIIKYQGVIGIDTGTAVIDLLREETREIEPSR